LRWCRFSYWRHGIDETIPMNSISFLLLFAACVPAFLVARIWWLAKRCDDALTAYQSDQHNLIQGTP
jgi:hypothetical protein